MRGEYADQHTVAVTHGDVITFLIFWANNVSLNSENKAILSRFVGPDVYPATASISTFVFQTNNEAERPQFDYYRPY